MKARRYRFGACLLPIVLAALPGLLPAKQPANAGLQRVMVFPDHYAVDGKRFADLDKLDDWVRSSGTRSVEYTACMWTANERLTAAIERIQYVYVDVRWQVPGKAGCPAVAPDKAAAAN